MSISKKIYKAGLALKEITSRKGFSVFFMFFLTTLLFFGTMNIFAASADPDDEFKIAPAWKETKWYHNLASGLSGDKKKEDNMNSRQGTELLNSSWTIVSLLAPEITNYQASAGDDIPYDLRRGLLGLAEDAGTTIYAAYPIVNISEHLAQQWVPGYKENVTSLYAANSSSGHPSGYEELMKSGVVDLWTRTLNLSYIFFVLVMIVGGFMIMFRHKLGGQTMVTLGSVLPKVIIALILATFSFAIAGLIIDFGGVLTGLAAYILGDGAPLSSISGIRTLMATVLGQDNVKMGFVSKGVIQSFGLTELFEPLNPDKPLGLFSVALLIISLVVPVIGGAIGAVAMFLIIIILGIIFFGAIKVLITLFKAYFSLLIAVILGPIQITLGAIPGNAHMIQNWLLSVLRNVLVFPVVFFILNIPNALASSSSEILFRLPGKLVYEDPNTYSFDGISAGGVFNAILRVFVLYFAAQAPKFLETLFPPSSSKAMGEGVAAAKGSLSKIPLVGSMFK